MARAHNPPPPSQVKELWVCHREKGGALGHQEGCVLFGDKGFWGLLGVSQYRVSRGGMHGGFLSALMKRLGEGGAPGEKNQGHGQSRGSFHAAPREGMIPMGFSWPEGRGY